MFIQDLGGFINIKQDECLAIPALNNWKLKIRENNIELGIIG